MSMLVDETVPPHQAAYDFSLFEAMESEVRYYCRKFPVVFGRARGAELYAEDGRMFTDFFCGAGTLNYGHNHPYLKRRLTEYLADDGVMHGLDMYTVAKRTFLHRLREHVLAPRGLDHKVQFCGPTGTDAVEAALKVARKATGRRGIVSFTGAYHGMSRGSLAVTGSRRARAAGQVGTADVTFVPYEDGPAGPFDSIGYLERMLVDPSSGMDLPAAVIVEPLQMEGGVYPASADWLRRLRELTTRHGVLLIFDEIQSGCGRTGTFFCFEHAGVVPDVITLSKSIGGYGLPLSMVLFRPELDVWSPGEHTGTFRGNQLAFVAGAAACELWGQEAFRTTATVAARRLERFGAELRRIEPDLTVRGLGMVLGLDFGAAGGADRADRIQRRCFDTGLIVELCGRSDEVVKVLPPLTIDLARLERGLDLLHQAVQAG
ncbi:diaminobutyrate--2-oxoglutarate transaminase [Micromonospora echinofusca]|uniref:Diaminobutyrate--2-oxoglutarate transaminase n=1 Tax=Micromonospora echinofusca TaxID=47858 RepID=A0ABS3VU35_MICEH|nr:diaminobutyrate--2-oxoglutarate transaminase [Micromonospora echinofusca]MBO4208052.1 diaminobutyrate--2-oxoglutarate transaminase [Micromonospora echinofusca]